jgi:hypothetical protein
VVTGASPFLKGFVEDGRHPSSVSTRAGRTALLKGFRLGGACPRCFHDVPYLRDLWRMSYLLPFVEDVLPSVGCMSQMLPGSTCY